MLIFLSFDKNEAYTEKNCILPLSLVGSVPDSARDTPTTRRPTPISPSSPSLSQTGASARIPTSTSSSAPFLPSILISRISLRPTLPSRTSLPSSPTQLVSRNEHLYFQLPLHTHDTILDCSTRRYAWPSPCRTHPPLAQAVDRSSSHTTWTPAPPLRSHRLRSSPLQGERPLPVWDRARVEHGAVERQ